MQLKFIDHYWALCLCTIIYSYIQTAIKDNMCIIVSPIRTHLLLLDTSVALATLTPPEGLMVLKPQPRECAGLGWRYQYLQHNYWLSKTRAYTVSLYPNKVKWHKYFLIAPPGEYQCQIVNDRHHLKSWGSQVHLYKV